MTQLLPTTVPRRSIVPASSLLPLPTLTPASMTVNGPTSTSAGTFAEGSITAPGCIRFTAGQFLG